MIVAVPKIPRLQPPYKAQDLQALLLTTTKRLADLCVSQQKAFDALTTFVDIATKKMEEGHILDVRTLKAYEELLEQHIEVAEIHTDLVAEIDRLDTIRERMIDRVLKFYYRVAYIVVVGGCIIYAANVVDGAVDKYTNAVAIASSRK